MLQAKEAVPDPSVSVTYVLLSVLALKHIIQGTKTIRAEDNVERKTNITEYRASEALSPMLVAR